MLKKPCNINFWIENDLPSLWNFSENSSNLVPPSIPRLMCFAGNMGHHLETSEEGLCQERWPQGLQHPLQRLKESPAHFLAAQQNINCAVGKYGEGGGEIGGAPSKFSARVSSPCLRAPALVGVDWPSGAEHVVRSMSVMSWVGLGVG